MNAIQKIKKLRARVARPAQLLLKNSLKLSNKVSPEANAFVRGLKAKLARTFGIDVLGIDTKSWSRQVVIDRFDFGTGDYGIRVTLPESYVNASRGMGAGDLLEILSSDSNLAQGSYLVVEEANTGDVAEGQARIVSGTVIRLADKTNEVAVAATATLDLTADIILTSVATGTARNTNTFTIQVLAAAANPTNTVLVAFSGTAAAIVCTVTPNDGTNNSATPVALTTANLVELINTGAVTGKSVTLTDASSHRILQTATGGGATALADAGEGDAVAGTFSGGEELEFTSESDKIMKISFGIGTRAIY